MKLKVGRVEWVGGEKKVEEGERGRVVECGEEREGEGEKLRVCV